MVPPALAEGSLLLILDGREDGMHTQRQIHVLGPMQGGRHLP